MPAHVVEIMSSIQGEGLLVGCRQAFIRLAGCNLRCQYCDTIGSLNTRPAVCHLEKTPGKRDFNDLVNPLTADQVTGIISRFLLDAKHHSVSLTGGEPLLHLDFLKSLLPRLHGLGIPLFLETNGTLAGAMAEVRDWFDYISMDIKLPGQTGVACWQQHAEFLAAAHTAPLGRQGEGVYVKIVITPDMSTSEFDQAIELIAGRDPNIPLILQPVTPAREVMASPSPIAMLDWQKRAGQHLTQVRVIPQVHKMLGQL